MKTLKYRDPFNLNMVAFALFTASNIHPLYLQKNLCLQLKEKEVKTIFRINRITLRD